MGGLCDDNLIAVLLFALLFNISDGLGQHGTLAKMLFVVGYYCHGVAAGKAVGIVKGFKVIQVQIDDGVGFVFLDYGFYRILNAVVARQTC